VLTHDALRRRFAADVGAGGSAAPALARALEQIGWRAVQESTPEDVASHLVFLVDACVHEHHDVDLLVRAVAGLLRDHGPLLDGGLPSVEAYVPAAEELVRQYIAPSPRPGVGRLDVGRPDTGL
jgi:hypothetical protein